MAPKLYGDNRSPCVRAVLLAAEALNITLEYIPIDVVKKEHLSEEYLKVNPCHTVPALIDNGFTVWDSHAIMIYLAETYGNDNSVYPNDIKKRTVINQMLYFENGNIFATHLFIADSLLHKGIQELPIEIAARQTRNYEFIETFLTNSKFIAGSELTLADFSVWATLSNSTFFVPIDKNKYPHIKTWTKKMEQLPYSSINMEGIVELERLINQLRKNLQDKMAPKLYGDIRSPCVRAVLLTAKALNVTLEYISIDVIKKEQLSEEYLKINPSHTVPALIDNGFTVWDSHAIMVYLAETYGHNNPLYPVDIRKRAVINQMLHFDNGKIFAVHSYITNSLLLKGILEIPEDAAACQIEGYEFIETFLTKSKFIAGNELTIADFSFWTSLSDANIFVPIEKNKYPKIAAWMKTMEQLPYSYIHFDGLDRLKKLFSEMIKNV